jgi:hypothetical protein
MEDVKLAWLASIVGASVIAKEEEDGIAELLLDRRLMRRKGARISSFITGTVATFLPWDFLFNSDVLREVSSERLNQFRVLLSDGLPDFCVRAAAATLLFRSTRDGASAAAFHERCDDMGPTLSLIKDVDGNVFGGFAQKSWSSSALTKWLSDRSVFLFSVLNPHGTSPVLFPHTGRSNSLVCSSWRGPWFGFGIGITGDFDHTCRTQIIDTMYINRTGVPGAKFMTGNMYFRPAIVEVFSI